MLRWMTRGRRPERAAARRAVTTAALAVALAALAGCGSSSSSSSQSSADAAGTGAAATTSSAAAASQTGGTPFKILFIGDFSGPTKFYGALEYEGLQTAAAYWNQHGGIGGHQIALTKMDDGASPSAAATDLVKYVSAKGKPNWVYAGTLSNELSALIPLLKRYNLLGGGLGDTSNVCADAAANCPTAFFEGPREEQDADAAVNYMKAHGFTNVGLLAESNADTQNETKLIAQGLKAKGIKSETQTFPATAVSVTPEVAALKSAGADALFAAAIGPAVGYAAKARSQLGWSAPLIFDEDAASSDITKVAPASQLKGAVEEIYNSQNSHLSSPGITALINGAKQFGGIPAAGALDVPAYAWDDLVSLHDAALQGKSVDQNALIAALNNLDAAAQTDPLYLLDKRVQFTKSDHENVAAASTDYSVVPVGSLVDGQVQAPKG
jgi:ABC-type branched-subunit amino acid transport system substrate-binding protein